jgi:ATP-dependent DNA ligase
MKLCNAPYGLNDRTEAWVKLKPDYMEGVSETLDVVIVGGYLGQGTVRLAVWTFVCALFGVFTAFFAERTGWTVCFPFLVGGGGQEA